jgi:hypothetical protein
MKRWEDLTSVELSILSSGNNRNGLLRRKSRRSRNREWEENKGSNNKLRHLPEMSVK